MRPFLSILIIYVTLFSCKKYDEDRFPSTYTAEARLHRKGIWKLYEIKDVLTQQSYEISPGNYSLNSDITLDFRPSGYYDAYQNSDQVIISNDNYDLNGNVNYSDLFFQSIFPVDSFDFHEDTLSGDSLISFLNSGEYIYSLSENKNQLLIDSFPQSFYYWETNTNDIPVIYRSFYNGNPIIRREGLSFNIIRLELANMTLDLNGRYRFYFSKIKHSRD